MAEYAQINRGREASTAPQEGHGRSAECLSPEQVGSRAGAAARAACDHVAR
jgi:hypothetical protein